MRLVSCRGRRKQAKGASRSELSSHPVKIEKLNFVDKITFILISPRAASLLSKALALLLSSLYYPQPQSNAVTRASHLY